MTYYDKGTFEIRCDLCIHRKVCGYKDLFCKCRYFTKDKSVKESCCESCIHKEVCKYFDIYDKNSINYCTQWKGESK